MFATVFTWFFKVRKKEHCRLPRYRSRNLGIAKMYTIVQMFGIGKIPDWFLHVSKDQQGCIYLITSTINSHLTADTEPEQCGTYLQLRLTEDLFV